MDINTICAIVINPDRLTTQHIQKIAPDVFFHSVSSISESFALIKSHNIDLIMLCETNEAVISHIDALQLKQHYLVKDIPILLSSQEALADKNRNTLSLCGIHHTSPLISATELLNKIQLITWQYHSQQNFEKSNVLNSCDSADSFLPLAYRRDTESENALVVMNLETQNINVLLSEVNQCTARYIDELMKTAIMSCLSRKEDRVISFGPRRFIILLAQTNSAGCLSMIDKIKARFSVLIKLSFTSTQLTFPILSAGAVSFKKAGYYSQAELLTQAKKALQKAQSGKNQVYVTRMS